jgi:hypothetical protein
MDRLVKIISRWEEFIVTKMERVDRDLSGHRNWNSVDTVILEPNHSLYNPTFPLSQNIAHTP